MERINEEDVDVYLQQMERVFATPPERDKRQENMHGYHEEHTDPEYTEKYRSI